MRSSDWKLVMPLSARLTISILLSDSFYVWKYLCMVMKSAYIILFDELNVLCFLSLTS